MASAYENVMPKDPLVRQGWANLQDIAAGARVGEGLRRAFLAELGDPDFDESDTLATIDTDTIKNIVINLKVNTTGGERRATPLEQSALNKFWNACRHKHEIPAIDLFNVSVPPPMISGGGGAPVVVMPATKKLKAATYLNQGSDMEFELLSPAELATRRQRWFITQGDHPRKDQDPTDEQLSCLAGTVGAHLVPYADWGVFGPNGIRMEREMKFKKWIPNPDGGGRYVEIRGADCLKSWQACWEVFSVAMVMEGAASIATLRRYASEFSQLAETYSARGLWGLCAQADIRCRSEQWPQLRRRMEAFHASNPAASTFDPSQPWNSVIRDSVGAAALLFWEEELKDPARLTMIDRLNSGGVPPPRTPPPPHFPPLPPLSEVLRQDEEYRKGQGKGKAALKKAKKVALKKKKKREDSKQGSVAADGTQVCFAWNRTAKGCVDGRCPNKRAHVCERCGQQHRAVHCKEPKVDNKSG
jgi:hypothetical protein